MSQLVNISSTGTFSAAGLRMGAMAITAGAGAVGSVVIKDGGASGTTVAQLSAITSAMGGIAPADGSNGFVFNGQPYASFTGAGASLTYEEM